MSTNVTIKAKAWGDFRFEVLASLCGLQDHGHALIRCARIWAWQTEHYTPDKPTYVVDPLLIEKALGCERAPEHMVRAQLAEATPDGYLIKGSKGTVEWLYETRAAGLKGSEAAKRKRGDGRVPAGNPNGRAVGTGTHRPTHDPNHVPTLTSLYPDPDPVSTNQNKNSATPSASGKRPPKSQELTQAEQTSVRVVLEKLSAQNGVRYTITAEHRRLIVGHLRAGVTEMDLRAVIGYCALELGWKTDPQMSKYLRPETLFGPRTIARYLDPARTWLNNMPSERRPRSEPDKQEIAS